MVFAKTRLVEFVRFKNQTRLEKILLNMPPIQIYVPKVMNEFESFMLFGRLCRTFQMWIFPCGYPTLAPALGPYAGGAGGAAPRWCFLIYTLNSICI